MIVEAVKGVTNFIGRLGENEARVMRFPIREMLNEFPGCTFTLANRRPNDADAYPSPNIAVNGDYLDWTVTSGDLASVGFGECEVIASVDGKVMKSDIYQTVIKTALDDSGTVPEPWEGWVTEVTEAAEQADAAVEHYPKIIEGYWYVWQDGAWVSTGEKAQGEQGDPGDPGAPGQDGVSPTVYVEDISGGHRVTITDAEGDHTFDVMDGQSGGGGTSDYEDLSNKPQIGGVELVGNKSLSDLGAAAASDIPDVTGKADKVANATSGNFAGLDSNGNLTDSGKKASDFLTEHQDINGKLDKTDFFATEMPMASNDSTKVSAEISGLKSALSRTTPEQFGAKGDGTTDDSQAVQDAVDAGYEVRFGDNKTYYLASEVTIDHDCHLVGGENTVIKTQTPSGGTVNSSFVIQGTLKKTTTLTSDYTNGGNTDNCTNKFTLSDMDGISIGDIIVIVATDQYYHYAREYYYLGATLLITDIYDGHIYTSDNMPWDITNTENVSVQIYSAPTAIIENLNFISDLDSLGAYRYFISLQHCKNSIIQNCNMTQMANGIRLSGCVNTKIDCVSLSKSKYDNSLTGDDYGISVFSSTRTTIQRIMATCAQHAITITGDIPSIDTYIKNCELTSECRNPGLDTHEATYNLVVEDCVLGTAALNGTCILNRCKIINNKRASTNQMGISVYGSHNPEWSSVKIYDTYFNGTLLNIMHSSTQNPIQAYDNVFGSIELENCKGVSVTFDPSTSGTILSNTVNRMSMKNCKDCDKIYVNGTGKIKFLKLQDNKFSNRLFITDNNENHGVVLDNIMYLDFSMTEPLTHKVCINRDTLGENVVLPDGVEIQLSSSNSSAKYIVCGNVLVSDNIGDYCIGQVGGSAGSALTRTVATGANIPTIAFDSSGDIVFSQGNSNSNYCFYPIGMIRGKEQTAINISTKLVNSGETSTGSTFRPAIAVVDCKTGKLVDRYFGTGQAATSEGVNISYTKVITPDQVALCYLYCSSVVYQSETTFKDFSITSTPRFAPPTISDDEGFIAKRLTGDGTIKSLAGVNNIMCSDTNFHVTIKADLLNSSSESLQSIVGVSF